MQLIGKRCPENKEQILTALDKQARELANELFFAKKHATKGRLILEAFTQVREQTVQECAQLLKGAIYDGESISAEIFNKVAAPPETTEQEER